MVLALAADSTMTTFIYMLSGWIGARRRPVNRGLRAGEPRVSPNIAAVRSAGEHGRGMWPCQIHGPPSVYDPHLAIVSFECYLPRPGAVSVGTFPRNDRPKRTQQWHRAAAARAQRPDARVPLRPH